MSLKDSARRPGVLRTLLSPAIGVRRSWNDMKMRSGRDVLDRLESLAVSDVTVRVDEYGGAFSFGPRSHLLRRILETGSYEPDLAELFSSLIRPDRDVIDVGANVGLFSILAARKLGTGKLLAAEPTDGAFGRLAANVEANGLAGKVIMYKGLVAQSDSMALLNVVPGREEYSSMAGLVHPSAVGEVAETQSIQTRSIDSLVAEHGLRPALMKVDVEGAEGMVFEGAEKTLKEHRPVVLSEFSRPLLRKNGSSPEKIVALFERCGYEVRNPFQGTKPGAVDFDEIIATPV